jgi:hypothetical protein
MFLIQFIYIRFSHGVIPDEDLSLIRVYFPMADSTLYKVDVLYTWYDILSKFLNFRSFVLRVIFSKKLHAQ